LDPAVPYGIAQLIRQSLLDVKLRLPGVVGQFEETLIPEKAAALKTAALRSGLGAASAMGASHGWEIFDNSSKCSFFRFSFDMAAKNVLVGCQFFLSTGAV
jgi:hypothetical protein